MSEAAHAFVARVNRKPLPRELFMELLGVALDAMTGKRRELPPDAERCLEDLPPNTLYLKDIPMNQVGMSIVSECHARFPDDEEAEDTSFSFLMRLFAIQQAKVGGRLTEFTKPGNEPGTE